VEELAGGTAKELNQRGGSGAIGSLGSDPQEEFLKGIFGVGVGQGTAFRRRRRIDSGQIQNITSFLQTFLRFSQVIESNGKLSRHLNLSQGKWADGCLRCQIPRKQWSAISL
jgi:hypothetical protein